jgi:hypothetical protein
MGRNTDADKTPLLQNAEQNIGNSATILPQTGSGGVVIPQTNPQRILELSGGSAVGQTTTIVMTASRITGADNPYPGFPGPVTGVIEFGNGGRSTKIEFDVPVGPFQGYINQALPAVEPQDGIVVVTVPTGVLRVYARYDNLLVSPLLGTNPPQSHAQVSSVPFVGPGGPLFATNPGTPPPVNILVPPEPVLVKAMVAYFTKPRAKVYKTLNCYLTYETFAPVPAPVAINVGTPSVSQIAGYPNVAFWALPAFTKSVKILRFPGSTSLNVLLHDGVRPVDFITVPGGTTAPVIEVIGNENIIGITSGSQGVTMLKLVCEVGI